MTHKVSLGAWESYSSFLRKMLKYAAIPSFYIFHKFTQFVSVRDRSKKFPGI